MRGCSAGEGWRLGKLRTWGTGRLSAYTRWKYAGLGERAARRIAAIAPDSGAIWSGQKRVSPDVVMSCRMQQDISRLRIPCDRR
jgi:hypothetical protein